MKFKIDWKLLSLSLGIVVLDQSTKILTKHFMILGHSRKILGNFLRYTYIENTGMAFGIHVGSQLFFAIFSVLASLVIFFYLIRARDEKPIVRFSLALILGGAIGNLIDRIFLGAVVDFIDIGFGSLRWYVFNLADTFVSIGMILLITAILLRKEETNNMSEQSQTQLPAEQR